MTVYAEIARLTKERDEARLQAAVARAVVQTLGSEIARLNEHLARALALLREVARRVTSGVDDDTGVRRVSYTAREWRKLVEVTARLDALCAQREDSDDAG